MGTPGHMRLPHRLQGQKVKSQGHGAGAYCGGHLAAQLVELSICRRCALTLVDNVRFLQREVELHLLHSCTDSRTPYRMLSLYMLSAQF